MQPYDLGGRVRIVKVGSCTVDPGNLVSPTLIRVKHQLGIGGGSTVVLLRDGADTVLVDTGFDREADASPTNEAANWSALRTLLELAGVHPSEITKVFITHFHRDHSGGVVCFPQAQWYCSRPALEDRRAANVGRFIPLGDGDRLTANAKVVLSPGHTRGHASVLWQAGSSVRVAIAGDAVLNLGWLESGYVWRFNADFLDEDMTRSSARRLLRDADIIIPGHGQPFFSSPQLLAYTAAPAVGG